MTCDIISKSSGHAAIAQSVERILGKDEVASSNLASSSIKQKSAQESGLFVLFRCDARFERSNATRMSVAAEGWTEANIYFAPQEQNADKSASSFLNQQESSICRQRRPPYGRTVIPTGMAVFLFVTSQI